MPSEFDVDRLLNSVDGLKSAQDRLQSTPEVDTAGLSQQLENFLLSGRYDRIKAYLKTAFGLEPMSPEKDAEEIYLATPKVGDAFSQTLQYYVSQIPDPDRDQREPYRLRIVDNTIILFGMQNAAMPAGHIPTVTFLTHYKDREKVIALGIKSVNIQDLKS